MSRPEGVTAEAWEQAETYKQLWARGPCTIKEAVARAITAAVAAEREACAMACEQQAPTIVGEFFASIIRARSES